MRLTEASSGGRCRQYTYTLGLEVGLSMFVFPTATAVRLASNGPISFAAVFAMYTSVSYLVTTDLVSLQGEKTARTLRVLDLNRWKVQFNVNTTYPHTLVHTPGLLPLVSYRLNRGIQER